MVVKSAIFVCHLSQRVKLNTTCVLDGFNLGKCRDRFLVEIFGMKKMIQLSITLDTSRAHTGGS